MIIKVCGLKESSNILQVDSLHPDFIGMIFHRASPRFVSEKIVPGTITPKVGVFVDSSIDDIIQQIRAISNDLMPGTLLRKGVIFAIEEFIDSIAKVTPLDIIFTHRNIPELSKEQSINIYRIVQEIVHNTLKHAKATLLNIELAATDKKLVFTSEDNGIGFNYSSERNENTGLGLRNLLSRTEVMGGDMYVESAPGQGTKYTIEIPIPTTA